MEASITQQSPLPHQPTAVSTTQLSSRPERGFFPQSGCPPKARRQSAHLLQHGDFPILHRCINPPSVHLIDDPLNPRVIIIGTQKLRLLYGWFNNTWDQAGKASPKASEKKHKLQKLPDSIWPPFFFHWLRVSRSNNRIPEVLILRKGQQHQHENIEGIHPRSVPNLGAKSRDFSVVRVFQFVFCLFPNSHFFARKRG